MPYFVQSPDLSRGAAARKMVVTNYDSQLFTSLEETALNLQTAEEMMLVTNSGTCDATCACTYQREADRIFETTDDHFLEQQFSFAPHCDSQAVMLEMCDRVSGGIHNKGLITPSDRTECVAEGSEETELIGQLKETETSQESLRPLTAKNRWAFLQKCKLWWSVPAKTYFYKYKKRYQAKQFEENPKLYPPVFILVISVIEVAVYLYWETLSPPPDASQSVLIYDPDRRQQVWRFLTYMLLHSGDLHIALNVTIQLLLGSPLEVEHHGLRVGAVYFSGVLGGSLGTSVLEPGIYIVGASGGVYALLTSHLANIILNFDHVRYKMFRALAVIMLALADIAFSVYHHYYGTACPRIGWAAHCSGAICGLFVGLLVLRVFEDKMWKTRLRWTVAWFLATVTTLVVIFNMNTESTPAGKTAFYLENNKNE